MSLSEDFIVSLVNACDVPNTQLLVRIIRDAIGPAAKKAGRPLVINQAVGQASGDRVLYFSNIAGSNQPPCAGDILGDQGGSISIGAHKDARVCGRDLASRFERVFDEEEQMLTRAIANTAVHELGHMIADLPHVDNPKNYMYSKGLSALPPHFVRNRELIRESLGGAKQFTQPQIDRLAEAIRTGKYADTFESQTLPR